MQELSSSYRFYNHLELSASTWSHRSIDWQRPRGRSRRNVELDLRHDAELNSACARSFTVVPSVETAMLWEGRAACCLMMVIIDTEPWIWWRLKLLHRTLI